MRMLQKSLFQTLRYSFLVHALVAIIVVLLNTRSKTEPTDKDPIELEIVPQRSGTVNTGERSKIDLRPHFLKVQNFFSTKTTSQFNQSQQAPNGISNPYSREFLFTESKVLKAFDLLAEKINQHLDYPTLLVENGVQGTAALDLYFDHHGKVDELKSKFFGGNRLVRGLLVQASRQGLIQWYASDAEHLNKAQFKDQHFRAEFVLSYLLPDSTQLEKTTRGSYKFLRRKYLHECTQAAGLNLVCLAAKTYGSIQSHFSSTYRMRFDVLRDRLEHFDNLGLDGIEKIISGS